VDAVVRFGRRRVGAHRHRIEGQVYV
jgi:hypothetical protein